MKQLVVLFFAALSFSKISIAQDSTNIIHDSTNILVQDPSKIVATDQHYYDYGSPYKTKFIVDAPIIIAGLGLTYWGNTIIKNKAPLTQAELDTKTVDKIPFFDKGNAGYYSNSLNKASYIPFLASFPLPLIMMVANKNERKNASQILVMYLEAESITGALYTMTNGLTHRPRPLVYGTIAPIGERLNKNNQRSFYAGHTASSATATFFAAKVFSDLNPDSKAKTFVWIIAAAIPATVGYMRYQSGFHFLSDNLLGYFLGAASGILIPQWHKTKASKNLSFLPQVGKDYKGFSLVYNIK
jgi:Membrane-associated phospholipid phosphatase